jgi:hypothetical protein
VLGKWLWERGATDCEGKSSEACATLWALNVVYRK